ncbi:prepilin-type N-terminal cleavage/methylation domain-containing protein [Phormidium tenue FACHB-886]|nr:prepilin-type N-terminal cleavage/methylation domain-containing protein [Phormidium tenue FACHB-886]
MRQSRQSTAGYTLVEMIVVLVIIGILAAIAAPGWLAFMNSRRANAARDQVAQVLRQAQAQARKSKSVQAVTFDSVADPPTLTALGVTQRLGDNQLEPGIVKLQAKNGTTAINRIEFDPNGNIQAPAISEDQGLKVTVTVSTTAKRCVIVQTLLGATRSASGSDCD